MAAQVAIAKALSRERMLEFHGSRRGRTPCHQDSAQPPLVENAGDMNSYWAQHQAALTHQNHVNYAASVKAGGRRTVWKFVHMDLGWQDDAAGAVELEQLDRKIGILDAPFLF